MALTVLALIAVPSARAGALYATVRLPPLPLARARLVTSCGSALVLCLLLLAGALGPRDPLSNPLPLAVWTVIWVGLISLIGILGNLWSFLNPLTGPSALLRRAVPPWLRYPARLGRWPAVAGLCAFAYLLLADPAPADPDRLARIGALYWACQALGAAAYGPRWIAQAELFTVLCRSLARVGALGAGRVGLPGWQIVRRGAAMPVAVLSVLLLGIGSFDGLNETFWWLGILGINPFEYPGRSALIVETMVGLLVANLALFAAFVACLALGLRLAAAQTGLAAAFRRFAPTLLPIALGYHVAHYLPTFLVDGQYALVALSDPLLRGWDLLGLGEFYVTTGFFNSRDSVRAIYLTQAGAVVLGHVLAVLAAHGVALRAFGSHRAAVRSQAPLACFMVAYTFFGLWLLASPRF